MCYISHTDDVTSTTIQFGESTASLSIFRKKNGVEVHPYLAATFECGFAANQNPGHPTDSSLVYGNSQFRFILSFQIFGFGP